MDTRTKIKIAMLTANVKTDGELAKRCGWTQQGLSERFKRNTWKISDLEKIAQALDCKLIVEFKPLEK